MWNFYLLSLPDDKDPTKDKTLSENISHEAIPESPYAIHPHSNTQECQETQLPLTRPIKTSLQAYRNASLIHAELKGFFTHPKWVQVYLEAVMLKNRPNVVCR